MPANMNHYDAAVRICVDQVTDGRICGRAVSRRLLRPFSFSDIGGLLLQLEEVLDAQNFPQAFERTRTFCPERGEGSAALAAKDLNSGMSREEVEAARGERADVVFLDPPRAGSTPEFLGAVDRMGPERIVYISCNPETQQRDVDALCRAGYRVSRIQPVDMFPQTAHLECICLLER